MLTVEAFGIYRRTVWEKQEVFKLKDTAATDGCAVHGSNSEYGLYLLTRMSL